MRLKVRYKGAGGEIFPELNWAPLPGDVREIEVPDGSTLEDHPTLEETIEEETAPTEIEIALGQAEDPEEEDNE